ncbi:transporter, betaine/carnitine/choline transporter (BCCT) family [Acididesulfobacillus acetoxydans]|uniref:L-carnitine/gamma-butyrobetaine antiporter n=2 Tax=Acididesulfobacillus acetoxydans TaxID=1561005 RepID=A0A8S0WIK8_9FIRM|nr:transporter, betaine/carnitine/choline transporter (BCCT) family [Acididesulfobacillus acetoxydans]CEJ07153.1 L-carnitine/gamma-butyrobetaine antiporter [Acididesulfobacillus acetoxydans]
MEPWVFFPPLLFVVAFIIWVFKNSPAVVAKQLAVAYSFVTDKFGGILELYVVVLFILCLYFIFGPQANKRLGDEKPDFSTMSWLGMIFTSFAGLGVLTWGSIEFFYYIQTPPFGIKPFSTAAYSWSMAYPLFHWGFTAWAMNTIFGLVFAYLFFVKKKDVIRPSTACEPLFGERLVKRWLGKLIDALFVIGFVCGVTTCIGVNLPTIIALVTKIFGLQDNLRLDTGVILSWSFLMAILLYTGLKKGIRYLSDFRVYFGFGILAFIFVFGPTASILNTFTDSLGKLMGNFVRMSMYTDPYYKTGVPQSWTIFYWAWYLALVIQCGIFMGRISKGRTVREYVIGSLAAATAGSWIFFAVFSGFSMHVLQQGIVPIADIMAKGGQGAAIVAIWDKLPLAGIMLVILLIYGFIAMQTLLNGATYTLSMVTTQELSGEEEPPKWNRIFWSITLGVIAVAMAYIGGIRPSQTMTIIGAVPMFVITVLILVAFFKDLKNWPTSKSEDIS